MNNIDNRYLISGVNSAIHLKLLKKCKSACSGKQNIVISYFFDN